MAPEAVLEECRERQEDEIVALQSIFSAPDDGEADDKDDRPSEPRVKLVQKEPEPILELYLPITLPRPTRIAVHTYTHIANRSSSEAQELEKLIQSQKPKRNGQNRRSKPAKLNAKACAFLPSSPALAASPENSQLIPQQSKVSAKEAEDAADTLCGPSLRQASNTESDTTSRRSQSPQNQRSQQPSTKLLSALVHLAPITLRVRLPQTYPAEQPPIIEDLTAPWLPSTTDRKDPLRACILQQLDLQYREMSGMEVLYIWATYLSEGFWASLLEDSASSQRTPPSFVLPDSALESSRASLYFEEHLQTPDAPPQLASQLIAHSRMCSRTTFDASSFDCAICLETRKGRACTRLAGCGHVFCSVCLAGYLSSLVDDGFHRQAKRCPDPECVALWSEREKQNLVDQEGNVIPPSKIKNPEVAPTDDSASPDSEEKVVVGLVTRPELSFILGPTRLAQLDGLSTKAKFEADPSVSYCPRSGCQAPVVRLATDENSGHWERFRECLSCGFAFCAWCSRSWHGPTSCPVSFQSELICRYLSLPRSSPDRAIMEQKFGRKTLETMVRKYEEEQQTQRWLSEYTTPCPTCGIAIEKSYGCNHMICKSCQTHYCYLCGKPISSQNPYQHFNTPVYDCYHRLFDGLLGDQAPQQARELGQGEEGRDNRDRHGGGQVHGGRDGDGRPGFALLLDENGIPIHLEPEDHEMDLLAWQHFV